MSHPIPGHDYGENERPDEAGYFTNKTHKKHDLAVKMSKPAFIKEHKKLVKVLRHGKRSDLAKEAKEQNEELKEKE